MKILSSILLLFCLQVNADDKKISKSFLGQPAQSKDAAAQPIFLATSPDGHRDYILSPNSILVTYTLEFNAEGAPEKLNIGLFEVRGEPSKIKAQFSLNAISTAAQEIKPYTNAERRAEYLSPISPEILGSFQQGSTKIKGIEIPASKINENRFDFAYESAVVNKNYRRDESRRLLISVDAQGDIQKLKFIRMGFQKNTGAYSKPKTLSVSEFDNFSKASEKDIDLFFKGRYSKCGSFFMR